MHKVSSTCTIMMSALLLSPFLSGKLQEQTYDGSVTLSTQAAVNAFYYSEVTGNLVINSGSLITDLSDLSKLTKVGGSIGIMSNHVLTSPAGLDNLASVGGSLRIVNNGSFKSLAAWNHLTSVGAHLYINYSLLTSLAGLDHLTSAGRYFAIYGNDVLTSLTGLNQLRSAGGFGIYSDSSLTSLAGLDNLTSVGRDLSIQRNTRLSACCILPSLTANVIGSVTIFDNAPGCNNLADISAVCAVPATLTVRYWFTADGCQPLFYMLDYAKMESLGVSSRFVTLPTPLPAADTHLELGFTAADSLYPLSSTGNLLQRIRKSDWSPFNQLNDFSYLNSTALSGNMKMTAYVKGALVYVTEPAATSGIFTPMMQKITSRLTFEQAKPAHSLNVTALGNPVRGNTVEILINGAQSKRVTVTLADALGKVVSERQVAKTIAGKRISMPVGDAATQLLYIRISTDRKVKTVSVLKAR